MSEQFENAIKMAMSAYEASNEEEAKSFFNQALTINPNSTLAKVGKGAAVLISFSLAGAARDAGEAFTLWQQAEKNTDFGNTERDFITAATISFLKRWHQASEAHYKQFKDTDSASNDRDQVRENLLVFLSNLSGLNGFDSHVPFLESAVKFLNDTDFGFSFKRTELCTKFEESLFIYKHQYKDSFVPALNIMKERKDWDGDFKVKKTSKKLSYDGNIDIYDSKRELKIDNLSVGFYADGTNNFSFHIEKTCSFAVGASNAPIIAEECKNVIKEWRVSADGKKVELSCSINIKNDELVKKLPELNNQINAVVDDGKKILEIIAKNGGKLGLFASIFGGKK